ncbi:hypothetical protein GCM10027048_27990 [Hymenobacter coalescens]
MARPARLNADYFTHNADLRNDRRVKAIRTALGPAGYGLFHMVLEALTDADHTALDTSDLEVELLAGDFGVSATEIHSLLQFAEKVGYFGRNDAGLLICPELNKWLEPVFEKRNRSRNPTKPELLSQTAPATGVSVTEIPQSKVKESKGEESKEHTSSLRSEVRKAPEPSPAQKKIAPEPSAPRLEILPDDSDAQASRTGGGAAEPPRLQFQAFAQSPYATEEALQALAAELKLQDVNATYYLQQIGLKAGREDNRTPEAWRTYATRFLTNDAKHGHLVTNTIPLDPQRHAIDPRHRQPARSGAAARLQVTPPSDPSYGYGTPTARTTGPFGGN